MSFYNLCQKNLNKRICAQLKTLFWILVRDLYEIKTEIKSLMFDSVLWPLKSVLLFGYVMPGLGLGKDYGPFILVSNLVTISWFMLFDQGNKMLNSSRNNISYELTLPISTFLIFFRTVITFTLKSAIAVLTAYTVGVLILGNLFCGFPVSALKSIFFFLLSSFMLGALTLVVVSKVKAQSIFYSIYGPFLFYLWDFGCYLFSWQVLLQAIVWLAYLVLLNPVTYAMEGIRSAALGPENYLNFWLCFFVVFISFLLFLKYGISGLKKKFDSL